MHREFDAAGRPFQRPSDAPTYLLAAVVGGLLLADLWPPFAAWLAGFGPNLPTFPGRTLFGVRLALIAAVVGGAPALFSAVETIPAGKVGADLAVAVACLAAILLGEPVVAAEVVAIGLLGECLEAFTFDRTRRAMCSLAELFPLRAWVLRDGVEVRAFTADLLPGDRVVVKPGGKIPVDGTVEAGRAAVDTASLTGESVPRDVATGDTVLAGSIVSAGTLTVLASKTGPATAAGRMIALTTEALKNKAPAERHADALARKFLPAVLLLALLAFAVNYVAQAGPGAARMAAYPALAVLVVACPCPLVLATPAAVIAALGRLAGTGILVKGGAALERLAGVSAFAFDKTGTLTTGTLSLGTVTPLGGTTSGELLSLAAAAEAGSEHPLARMIVTAAGAVPPATDFVSHAGGGVTANVNGDAVAVGSRRFLESLGVAVPDDAAAAVAALDAAGQTAVMVSRGGRIAGVIGGHDTPRPEAPGVIADLTALGLKPVLMLTGDRAAAAQAVAGNWPLDGIHAGLLPAEKVAMLPANAAFVGDGVNDAAAIAAAGAGLAVAGTADVACEAADVVLMGEPLRHLPMLVRLARETVAVVRQNVIVFGFGVNLVGVIGAGFVWPRVAPGGAWTEAAPLAGVIYHQLGSLLVLLNSMRLLAFERPRASRWAAPIRAAGRFDFAERLDELLHFAGRNRGLLLRSAAGFLFLAWAASGLTAIPATDVGVVRRFGAFRDDLAPGLHVRWPWPVEEVATVAPREVRQVPVGFRLLTDEQKALLPPRPASADATWAGPHADGVVRLTDESILLTGDGNLVEVLATVRYTVTDPRTYLFGVANPDGTIRSTAEAVLRELAAAEPFLELLTTGRPNFEKAAARRLAARLPAIGVTLDGLTVHDLHPPQEVVNAYHDVAAAVQTRDRLVNAAEADALRTRRRAEETATKTVRDAEAAAAKTVADAAASHAAFLAWHHERNTLPAADETPDPVERGRRLAVRRTLTEFRLSLAAAVAALSGRDKVLIDADGLPGRRQLLLIDPEAGKLPAWLTRPQTPPPTPEPPP